MEQAWWLLQGVANTYRAHGYFMNEKCRYPLQNVRKQLLFS